MNTVGKRLAVFLSAITTSLAVTAPAAIAEPPDSPPSAISWSPSALLLSVSSGEGVRPAARRVLLRCHPTGGDHPKASAACTRLASRDGDLAALNADPGRACVLLYAPVTVTASGSWHGRLVRYQETFGNTCALRAKTGTVFQF